MNNYHVARSPRPYIQAFNGLSKADKWDAKVVQEDTRLEKTILAGMQTSANIASTGSQSNALMVDDNEIRDSIKADSPSAVTF
jgi:hypothetical protein